MRIGRNRQAAVRFRVSLAGWVFLALATALGAAAMKTDVALLHVLFGSMLGTVIISAVLSGRMVRSIRLSRDVPDRVWQNQTVHLGYYLRNVSRRIGCTGIEVREIAPEGIASGRGYCLHLPPGAAFRSGARFTARRRGRVRLRGVTVATSFPFGLIVASRQLHCPVDLVVWPARGHLTRPLLASGAVETSAGAPSQTTGGQDEFFGVREYRPGDNTRWIHWRKSATRQTPVMREMARPLPEALWLVLDSFCDGRSEDDASRLERMIRFAATLADHAFSRGYQVGLATAADAGPIILPPAAGKGHRAAVLDALADIKANAVPLPEVIDRLPARKLRQAEVVAAVPGAADANGLASLRRRCRRLRLVTARDLDGVYKDAKVKEADS